MPVQGHCTLAWLIAVSLLLLSSAGGANTSLQDVQPQSTTEHAKHRAAIQAVAVSQLLSSLRNLTTISQRSTDKLSNKPGQLAGLGATQDVLQIADASSSAASLLDEGSPAISEPEMQQILCAVTDGLEALQSQQRVSGRTVPLSRTQQQELAAYGSTEHKAPLSPPTEGPVGIASWEAASRLHQAKSSPVQGQVPPEEPQGPVLVIHEAVVQELSVAVASLLDTLRGLQQKPQSQGSGTASSMLTTPADSVRTAVGSRPTPGSRVGNLRDVLNGQPATDKPPAGSSKSSHPASLGLPLLFSFRQQPGQQQQRPAADTQHQHNSPVKSTFLGALRDIGAKRPAGIHPANTAPLQQSRHGVRGNPAQSEESPITQPGPQPNPTDGVNSKSRLLTDKNQMGPGIFGRPFNSGRDGVKSPSSSQVTQDDNAQHIAEETSDTAQPCSTVVAVLKVQQEFPGELCVADQAKLDALREQVLGLLVPYFYSQAVMPEFTAGVLDAKCDDGEGLALVRVAIQACLAPPAAAQRERVTCVANYLTAMDTGNVCRQIPGQCEQHRVSSLLVGKVAGDLPNHVAMVPSSFSLAFDPCIARLPAKYCSSHTRLPEHCRQVLDSHGWKWRGQQLAQEAHVGLGTDDAWAHGSAQSPGERREVDEDEQQANLQSIDGEAPISDRKRPEEPGHSDDDADTGEADVEHDRHPPVPGGFDENSQQGGSVNDGESRYQTQELLHRRLGGDGGGTDDPTSELRLALQKGEHEPQIPPEVMTQPTVPVERLSSADDQPPLAQRGSRHEDAQAPIREDSHVLFPEELQHQKADDNDTWDRFAGEVRRVEADDSTDLHVDVDEHVEDDGVHEKLIPRYEAQDRPMLLGSDESAWLVEPEMDSTDSMPRPEVDEPRHRDHSQEELHDYKESDEGRQDDMERDEHHDDEAAPRQTQERHDDHDDCSQGQTDNHREEGISPAEPQHQDIPLDPSQRGVGLEDAKHALNPWAGSGGTHSRPYDPRWEDPLRHWLEIVLDVGLEYP